MEIWVRVEFLGLRRGHPLHGNVFPEYVQTKTKRRRIWGCVPKESGHQRTRGMVNEARRLGLFFPTLPHAYRWDAHILALSEQEIITMRWCDDRKCTRNITLHVKRTLKPNQGKTHTTPSTNHIKNGTRKPQKQNIQYYLLRQLFRYVDSSLFPKQSVFGG